MKDKVQPHRKKMERALLGDIMVDETCLEVVGSIVEPESFYSSTNQAIYEAILELKGMGKAIDQVSVVDMALNMNPKHPNPSDLIVTIAEYAGDSVSARNAEHYANQVREAHDRRDYLKGLMWAMDRAYDFSEDFSTTVKAMSKFEAHEQASSTTTTLESSLDITLAEIAEAWDNPEKRRGVPTGIAFLDQILGGYQPGELIYVAARPSVGKTSMLIHSLRTCGKKGFFVSAEMSKRMINLKLLSGESGIASHKLRDGNINEEIFEKLHMAKERLSEVEIWIEDRNTSTDHCERQCGKLVRDNDVAIMGFDYIQIGQVPNHLKTVMREQQISGMSQHHKLIASTYDIPNVVAAQLNREGERANRRPVLSDLRESGSLEQDADVVVFLHRPSTTDQNDPEEILELIVAKNRNGPVGYQNIRFIKATGRFEGV